ncbi:lipopolysaccharide biosynthesis protein [Sphingobium boeckii]|uniref:PST family polysaccharide transporter n=1 Tax=Sphingobium boeckii TaxID=1082345 RepID=A0A7W9AHG3_9SPHN|nr:lipopolysaccharide biosynthesis protein [Sphingobium boeckii]MBB5685765.1 PST family polysaccharide transporter [Sphingobium boeckii]
MKRDPFEAPSAALRGRVARGIAVSGLAQIVRVLAQICSVILLARLLPPAQFGLAAMAAPVLAIAVMFQEFGISQAIVQKPHLNAREASMLFWIGFGLSVALAIALLLIAPLVGTFYREPDVAHLTAAMALTLAVYGAGAQHIALLNRGMRFEILASLDAAGAVLGLVAALIWAWFDPTFWALYAGSLITALVPALGAWVFVGWLPAWPRRQSGAGGAIKFGAGVTGSNIALFFSRNMDNVLIGRRWGEVPLGLYDRAYKLMLMPLQQVNAPLARVMLPTLARMLDEPNRYRHAYLRTVNQLLLVLFPGIAFMTATSDLIVPFLLGDNWIEAAPIFAFLGLAGLVQSLNNTCAWLFLSQARTWELMRWGIFNAVFCVIGFVIGLPYGPVGVAAVFAIGEYIRTPLLWGYATRTGPLRWRDAFGLAVPHLLGAFAALGLVRLISHGITAKPLVIFAITLPVSYIVSYAVVAAFPQGRVALREALTLLGQAGRKVARRR